ncbi:hypothetical protein VOLCADRAFT_96215 [Volvox carteri f. nagariensis]|uniref:Uncharacterized protein n=1 Tax=Volvox carteri f. nagariensis TaxID=3068 RepID=D8U9I8_VOLCA|nr:uncharacterized protein VOLCADRAFT_96215 [Volvox carteri f. nagariensis]EFJ43649.1 hypothetical protein VOLCADRAFT_96215 [Volvox carteri f. nagariensis]|eukprot:XP_002955349.1 hypothetical protein VOLCADRAFT_96215 [Volvox carteri f. nagariensis]
MGATWAAGPSFIMVSPTNKAYRPAAIALAWATAAGLPLLLRVYVSAAVLWLWALAAGALVASLGAISKSQSLHKIMLDADADAGDIIDVLRATANEDAGGCETQPTTAVCNGLLANTSLPEQSAAAVASSPRKPPAPCSYNTATTNCTVTAAPALTPVLASPACTIAAAAAPSTKTSHAGSAVNSGQSSAVPQALVDSALAIAALRPKNLRYRNPRCTAAAATSGGNGLAGAGRGSAAGLSGRTQLHIKIPHLDPRDLRPDLVSTVSDALRAYDTGLLVVGAYVRRGCVELTLDLVECATSGPDGCGDNGSSRRDELELSTMLLKALRVPPPSPATAVAAAGSSGHSNQRHTVLFQRAGACWRMEWSPDAQQWQVCREASGVDGGTGEESDGLARLSLSAPLAVHAAAQLDPGAAAAGCGSLRLAVVIRAESPPCDCHHHCHQQNHRLGIETAADVAAAGLTVIARANGRTVEMPILSLTRRSIDPKASMAQTSSSSSGEASFVMVLELDLARLSSGRRKSSPGLVVQLELRRGVRVLDVVPVACLADERMVSELLTVQCELAAAGRLDTEDEAYASVAQQRIEAQELLGDLGAWLDFTAVCGAADMAPPSTAAAAAAAAAAGTAATARTPPPPPRDSLDVSDQVKATLQTPAMQRMMLSAGRHLLNHFVNQGHVALACAVHTDLAPRAAAAASSCGDAAAIIDDGEEGLPLLHVAVRSGRQAMVEAVLEWQCGSGVAPAVAADAAVWGACGPGGITALHLLAADARCGASAATADNAAEAEALLCWILSTWPGAVTVWNTARDARGNTPAMLWAGLGGHDLQVPAAVEALGRVADDVNAAATAAAVAAAEEEIKEGGNRGEEKEFTAAVTAFGELPIAGSSSSSSRSDAKAHLPAAAEAAGAAGEVGAVPAPENQEEEEERVERMADSSLAAPPGISELMVLSLRGFSQRSLEREYVDYVTRSTSPSTSIWLIIMVVAHVTAFYKSPNREEGRQAMIGGIAYVVSLSVMALAPRTYTTVREGLMLSCLLGRTLCRLLMTILPDHLHMSESVQKYVRYGIDILLDGFMEGTFEQARVPRALAARVLEWPVMAAFMQSIGVRPTYGAALLRAGAVSGAGAAMSMIMDVRARALFLRERRARAAATLRGLKLKAD